MEGSILAELYSFIFVTLHLPSSFAKESEGGGEWGGGLTLAVDWLEMCACVGVWPRFIPGCPRGWIESSLHVSERLVSYFSAC